MGEVDVVVLDSIHQDIKKLEKQYKWGFAFKKDLGTWETAIEFWNMGYYHPPKSNGWEEVKKKGNEIKEPDLLEWNNRIIIEYEEEPKPQRGPKIVKKGHTEESKRDSHRDNLYGLAGFRMLKVWESEYKKLKSNGLYEWESEEKKNAFETKLYKFLCDCYAKR